MGDEMRKRLFGDKELEAVGEIVTAITRDTNVVIFAGQDREHDFRIETDVRLTNTETGDSILVRYKPATSAHSLQGITELAEIIGTEILHACAYVDGSLELVFSNSRTLRV